MNNNDIRNISKNFFGIILPNYMTFLKRIINQLKMSALTFRSRLIIANLKKRIFNKIFSFFYTFVKNTMYAQKR